MVVGGYCRTNGEKKWYMMNFRMFMARRMAERTKEKLSIADNFMHEGVISLQIVKEVLQEKLYFIRQKRKSGDLFFITEDLVGYKLAEL